MQRLSVRQMDVRQGLQQHTSRPVSVQRQVVQPALQAADLHTQESKRLAVQRATLQREAAELGPISPEVMTQALQRQQQETPQVPLKPQSVGDWVTVMRFQAEQAQGRMMQTREAMQYTTLQRQVANQSSQAALIISSTTPFQSFSACPPQASGIRQAILLLMLFQDSEKPKKQRN